MGCNDFHHLRVNPGLLIGVAAQHVEVKVALADMAEQQW